MDNQLYDCIVIGAGPAGLSAALFLARYRRRVLVIHHNSPRNLYSHGVHGMLGHHGILPADLLARGRKEVQQHGGIIIEGCATHAERVRPGQFQVTVELERDDVSMRSRSFAARRLLLATGLRDVTPACPGFSQLYGRSVFHCPDCDGYEVSGKHVAVLGNGKKTVGFTLNLLTWTDRLTLITDDKEAIAPEYEAKLAALKIALREEQVVGLEGCWEVGRLERVRLASGEPLECDALFINLGTYPSSDLHRTLRCQLDEESGLVWVDAEQRTSIEGVYAAGDITPHSQLTVVAAAEGAMAAIHIHKSLLPEAWRI